LIRSTPELLLQRGEIAQRSAILPWRMRQNVMPRNSKRLPDGAMPRHGPWCTPRQTTRAATVSPSATMLSVTAFSSPKVACMAAECAITSSALIALPAPWS